MTIVDVRAAPTAEEHVEAVRRWCESVWEAWADRHEAIRRLAATSVQ